MRFSVGLPRNNPEFVNCIIDNAEHIYEVYFSWGDFPNGRSAQVYDEVCTPWELMDIQREALAKISGAKIPLNLLLNGNCYGRDSQSRAFFNKIGETVDYISSTYGLESVTTTSPLIAKFIKDNFEGISTRASVNMEIGSVPGMEYVADYFDSYYMKREYNRDFDKIYELKSWCDANGKMLFILGNSGCLNFCSAHNFHDNLVAHESEIAAMDNAYNFNGVCRDFLSKEENYGKIIDYTNFIRPEDISRYDGLVEAVKLATRVHKTPSAVLSSYVRGRYAGDILRLLEPAHSIYPYVLENGEPMRLVKLT